MIAFTFAPFIVMVLVFVWQQWWERADERWVGRQFDEKARQMATYAAARPDDPLAQELLGDALWKAGRVEEANGVFARALEQTGGRVSGFSGDIHAKIRLTERELQLSAEMQSKLPPRRARWEGIWGFGVLVALGLATFQLLGDREPSTALSEELARHNPLAWLTLTALTGVITSLALRLWHRKHRFRTAVLLLNLPALGVIACTDHSSPLHLTAFLLAILLTTLWLFIVYLDAGELLGSAVLVGVIIVGGLLFVWSPGMAERLMLSILTFAACWHHSAHLGVQCVHEPNGEL